MEKPIIVEKYMWEAFLIGCWYGQAEMEESMDISYYDAFLTSNHARKSGGQCMHAVASNGGDSRPVKYNLRSDKWRKAVFAKKDEFKKLIPEMIEKLNDNN